MAEKVAPILYWLLLVALFFVRLQTLLLWIPQQLVLHFVLNDRTYNDDGLRCCSQRYWVLRDLTMAEEKNEKDILLLCLYNHSRIAKAKPGSINTDHNHQYFFSPKSYLLFFHTYI